MVIPPALSLSLLIFSALAIRVSGTVSRSTADLWDTSNGITITASSPIRNGFAPSEIFGTNLSTESGDRIFADFEPDGFTHFIEWLTAKPVQLTGFNLFTGGDGPDFNNEREFAQFVLKAKP